MTRRSGTYYACTYVGCNKTFGSQRQLKLHAKTHEAAHPFCCLSCSKRFSTQSELQDHQGIHNPLSQDVELQVEPSQEMPPVRCEEEEHDIDADLKEEAVELVNNALYLASQLSIARSPKLGAWTDGDFDNAYAWTLWVEDALEDFPRHDYIEKKLAEHGVSLEAMRNCEIALFDSILAYDKFSSDTLLNLINSIKKEKDIQEHLEKLSNCLVRAINRRKCVDILSKVSDIFRNLTNSPPRDEYSIAKARILLRQHQKWAPAKIRAHLGEMDKSKVLELVCYEAIEAYDQKADCVSTLLEFLKGALKNRKWQEVQPRLLEDICERELSFLDSYLCYLLSEGLRERIAGLARRDGMVGLVTREVVTKFVEGTGRQELICWDAGT